MAPILGYWNIRGLGHPIRFLLRYLEEEYEEKSYELAKPDGTMGGDDWWKEKYELGLDIPNLPYYIDGDFKMTQSLPIMRYIAAKHGFTASEVQEKAKIEMLECEAFDMRMALAYLCYDELFEEKKAPYLEQVKPKLEVVSKFLAEKDFLLEKISTADFMMYEALACIRKFDSTLVDCHPNLVQYLERFEALPNIKKYMESDDYFATPMSAPMAKFGGVREDK